MHEEIVKQRVESLPDLRARRCDSFSFLAVLLAPAPFAAFADIVNFIRRVIAPAVPLWAAASVAILICGSTTMLIFGILRRKPTAAAGGCSACGYCLNGNTSGICPECGTAIGPARLDSRRTDPAGAWHEPKRKRPAQPT